MGEAKDKVNVSVYYGKKNWDDLVKNAGYEDGYLEQVFTELPNPWLYFMLESPQ